MKGEEETVANEGQARQPEPSVLLAMVEGEPYRFVRHTDRAELCKFLADLFGALHKFSRLGVRAEVELAFGIEMTGLLPNPRAVLQITFEDAAVAATLFSGLTEAGHSER